MGERLSLTQYTQDQRDCLQEICNIATGHTADVLARKLNAFVTLPIPKIQIIEAGELSASLSCRAADCSVYAASQHFSFGGFSCDDRVHQIDGLALVLLSENCLEELNISAESTTLAALAKDIGQPMIRACLQALCDQSSMTLNCDNSQFMGIEPLESICHQQTSNWHKVLLVEIHYCLESRPFAGDLLLLFPDQAIITMARKLDELLDF